MALKDKYPICASQSRMPASPKASASQTARGKTYHNKPFTNGRVSPERNQLERDRGQVAGLPVATLHCNVTKSHGLHVEGCRCKGHRSQVTGSRREGTRGAGKKGRRQKGQGIPHPESLKICSANDRICTRGSRARASPNARIADASKRLSADMTCSRVAVS